MVRVLLLSARTHMSTLHMAHTCLCNICGELQFNPHWLDLVQKIIYYYIPFDSSYNKKVGCEIFVDIVRLNDRSPPPTANGWKPRNEFR